MSIEEKKEVTDYLNLIYKRINLAKDQIRECNYGQALKTLSESYPQLKIKVDE